MKGFSRLLGLAILAFLVYGLGLRRSSEDVQSPILFVERGGSAVNQHEHLPTKAAPSREIAESGSKSDAVAVTPESDEQPSDRYAITMGILTRSSDPGEYQKAINRLAQKTALTSLEALAEKRAAEFVGFQSWGSLQAELDALQANQPNLAAQLQILAEDATGLSNYVVDCSKQTWDRSDFLEVWNPEQEHDTAEWKALSQRPEKGLLSFEITTRAGDNVFRLHFDSFDFPQLEQELIALRERKAIFWEAKRSL